MCRFHAYSFSLKDYILLTSYQCIICSGLNFLKVKSLFAGILMATLVLLSCHLNEIPPCDVNRALCTVRKWTKLLYTYCKNYLKLRKCVMAQLDIRSCFVTFQQYFFGKITMIQYILVVIMLKLMYSDWH